MSITPSSEDLRPSDRSPHNYVQAIAQYNRLVHIRARQVLREHLYELSEPSESRFSLVTTGSDGRGEKSPQSKIEVILLHENTVNPDGVMEKVNRITEEHGIFCSHTETKNIARDEVSIYHQYADRIFPTRALDAVRLGGNDQLVRQYQEALIPEMSGSEGKRKIEKFENTMRYHRKIAEDGGKRDEQHFDADSGILYYNGDRIKSTKYGHLRLVQYKLAGDIFKGMRRGDIDADFIKEFPRGTIDRLNYLYYAGNLNKSMGPGEIDDITSAYEYALYWYHLSEEKFERNEDTSIQVDRNELKEVSNIITGFGRKQGPLLSFNTKK